MQRTKQRKLIPGPTEAYMATITVGKESRKRGHLIVLGVFTCETDAYRANLLDYYGLENTNKPTIADVCRQPKTLEAQDENQCTFLEQVDYYLDTSDLSDQETWSFLGKRVLKWLEDDLEGDDILLREVKKVVLGNAPMGSEYNLVSIVVSGGGVLHSSVAADYLIPVSIHDIGLFHLTLRAVLVAALPKRHHSQLMLWSGHGDLQSLIAGNLSTLSILREDYGRSIQNNGSKKLQPIFNKVDHLVTNCKYTQHSIRQTMSELVEIIDELPLKDIDATDFRIQVHRGLRIE
jgi:hypothetical protein